MKIIKNIANFTLLILVIVSLFISGVYIYYHYCVKPNHLTFGTNYIGEQSPIDLYERADELSPEKLIELENRVLFNVNLYSNDKGNGIELQELRLDYFTDSSLSMNSMRSTGMQFIGDITDVEYSTKLETNKDIIDSYTSDMFFYYDTTDSISWSGGKVATQLNRNKEIIVKIDNKPYLIQLDGSFTIEEVIENAIFWIDITRDVTYLYTYPNLFQDVMKAVKTNSFEYGEYYIQLDLSEYFTNIMEYDPETNKFDKLPDVDIVNNYSYLKFGYYESGATSSAQSMFGSVGLDTKFGSSDTDVEYFNCYPVYTITEEFLTYRYSDIYDAYFASINFDLKNKINSFPSHKVEIILNTNSSYLVSRKINVIGLDYNAFEGFDVDKLRIEGSGEFLILDKAMFNTEVETFEYSRFLFLTISDTAFNNEYSGVVYD